MAAQSLYAQWVGDLNHLLIQHQTGTSTYEGITKAHWKPNSFRTKCANQKCNKRFSLTERIHHCRRCGDLFCSSCLQYQRRLNDVARLDPNGKLHKVCEECYEEGPQVLGQIRSYSAGYAALRRTAKTDYNRYSGIKLRKTRKDRLNVQRECSRLTEGFRESIGSSGLSKMVFDMKTTVTTPAWQRSPNWVYEKLCTNCSECDKNFSVTRVRHHCAICGAATCSKCSSKDLLIYIPDGGNCQDVQWAIIRIVGCPDKEPVTSIYFRTCTSCSNALQDIQVEQHKVTLDSLASDLDPWPIVIQINNRLVKVQAKIEQHLPQYQELVDALEISPGAARSLPASRKSNTQILAKAQCDLNDHFTQFVTIIMDFKKYKPNSQIKDVILRNVIRSKFDYYQENMYLFRECKRRLEEVTPAEVLENIQHFVNVNSLNSSYVCIKQLALECLHLCSKYNVEMSTPERLASLETVVLEDLKKAINQSGEDWTAHEEALNRFIKLQIEERRLIKPSQRLIKLYGNQYLTSLMDTRCHEVLRKVELQFGNRSADRSYQKSKHVISEFLEHYTRDNDQDMEWEVLSV